MSDDPLVMRPGEYTCGRVTPYQPNKPVMLDENSRVIRDAELTVLPVRSWQSALRQLASNWMDPYEEYGSPDSPEEGCATILAAAIAGEMHAEDRVRDRWVDALRQLADTLCPGADIEIDPDDPEASCTRIAAAVERRIAARNPT